MPSASTKPEKQAPSEAFDPIKQGIVLVEHKIRNLLKKKGRLDAYKDTQKSGKELDPDQKQALLKYDELCQNLAFAQDFKEQFNNISAEWSKQLKKKEKKEAHEREQQEVNKVKEILIIQDVLAGMGSDNVREDFLAGQNRAIKLTEAELRYLDELFVEVSPKREPEENQPPFQDQAQNAAKHLINIVEGKDKEIIGTKYSELKKLIENINTCGYFDHVAALEAPQEEAVVEEAVSQEEQINEPAEPEIKEIEPVAPEANFGDNSVEHMVPVVETAGVYISQRPMVDVLTNVMGTGPTTFNFIQESELEPEVPAIPTQTFTNANFAPPAVPVVDALSDRQPSPPTPPTNTYGTSQVITETGDWNESPEQSNDWGTTQVEQEQNQWSEATPATDEWADSDGFQTAGRGGGRGGRGRYGGNSDRGRGGPRGRGNYQNRGNNQNGRGGGGGYYNRNNGDGGSYNQNGYQSRGEGYRDNREGGPRRGGPRGGGQDRGGPRSDRGGPRGGRGNNSRGNYNRGGSR